MLVFFKGANLRQKKYIRSFIFFFLKYIRMNFNSAYFKMMEYIIVSPKFDLLNLTVQTLPNWMVYHYPFTF